MLFGEEGMTEEECSYYDSSMWFEVDVETLCFYLMISESTKIFSGDGPSTVSTYSLFPSAPS